jgi:hypothetical protein
MQQRKRPINASRKEKNLNRNRSADHHTQPGQNGRTKPVLGLILAKNRTKAQQEAQNKKLKTDGQ